MSEVSPGWFDDIRDVYTPAALAAYREAQGRRRHHARAHGVGAPLCPCGADTRADWQIEAERNYLRAVRSGT